jgi:hypothetical protein
VCTKVPIATLKFLIMNADTVLIGRARVRCMKRINASAPALAGGSLLWGTLAKVRDPDKNICSHGVGWWVRNATHISFSFLFCILRRLSKRRLRSRTEATAIATVPCLDEMSRRYLPLHHTRAEIVGRSPCFRPSKKESHERLALSSCGLRSSSTCSARSVLSII